MEGNNVRNECEKSICKQDFRRLEVALADQFWGCFVSYRKTFAILELFCNWKPTNSGHAYHRPWRLQQDISVIKLWIKSGLKWQHKITWCGQLHPDLVPMFVAHWSTGPRTVANITMIVWLHNWSVTTASVISNFDFWFVSWLMLWFTMDES